MADNPYAEFQSGGKVDPYAEFRSDAAPPISLTPGTPNSGAAGRFAENFAGAVNPVPGLMQTGKEAADPTVGLKKTLERHFIAPQMDQFSKAKDAITGSGEFSGMGLMGRASEAIGHGAAGMIPLVGPAAANIGDQIGNGDIAGGLGSGAGLIATTAAPEMLKATGRGLQRVAEPVAENALGIRNVDRAPNKTPGRAALDMTSGITPESVRESATDVIGQKAKDRDAMLGQSKASVSLRPARLGVDKAITKAQGGNSIPSDLQILAEHLTVPHEGFAGATQYPQGAVTPITINQAKLPSGGINPFGSPTVTAGAAPNLEISELQSPLDALSLRQRFGKDYTKFDHARPLTKEQMEVANSGYGKLTGSIHSAVPESAPLDRDISNLIPVRDSSRVRELNAGPAQRSLGRIAAHTGVLAGGAAAGYHAAGIPGAIAGLVLPELLADPTAQMAAARGINGAGKAIQSPFVTRPAQVSPFIKKRDEQK